jgi:DNA recombination protein RmuC
VGLASRPLNRDNRARTGFEGPEETPLEWITWAAGAALVAGIVVYAVMASGRRALEARAAAAESALAVAQSRLADLTTQHEAVATAHRRLGDEHLALTAERERLRTSLEKTALDLQREVVAAAELRRSLEETNALRIQLDSDCRVARTDRDALGERVARLEIEAKEAGALNRQQTDSISQLMARSSSLETERNGLQERLAAQQHWFEEQTRAFEQKILNMTNTLLDEKSQKFTEVNRREMDAVVAPFKEQLGEFRQRVDSIYAQDSKERTQLQEQVAQLARLNQTVSQRAEDLTRALTLSSKSTGDWGEIVLQRILEDSGLREGKEYVLQHTVLASNEEDVQRPDAIINLPEDRQVVVDAKVSNKAWTDYCSATDDPARDLHLAAHLASLRAHVRGLAERNYPHSPDLKTVDFVLMFVPVEAALLTAFAKDETLYSDAYRSKVIMVTPSTLMAVLKLIEGMWAFQKRKESADKIADAGRRLYEKLVTFSETFLEIGVAIERTHATFQRAQGQLATGRGNAIRLAQKMVELGVAPASGKALPPELAKSAHAADGEARDPAALVMLQEVAENAEPPDVPAA